MEVNKENLEDALNDGQQPQISKEEEIGYHKGSLSTLINERNELIKMAQVVESLMQAHMKRLEELGVKIQQQKK
ncbi:hypothetical protein HOD88_01715 [archaeon]|jgi:hypothetical protein|nr:hypothetical protein [archaeon]